MNNTFVSGYFDYFFPNEDQLNLPGWIFFYVLQKILKHFRTSLIGIDPSDINNVVIKDIVSIPELSGIVPLRYLDPYANNIAENIVVRTYMVN